MSGERKPEGVVDLLGPTGTGPLWGWASADRYLSVHRRRGPLQLAGMPERP